VKIDPQVEPLVREALAAAVKSDDDRFARALEAFPNDAALAHGVMIAVNAATYALYDEYGGRPPADGLRGIADKIAESETWAGIGAGEALAIMTAALDDRPAHEVLSVPHVMTLPFVVSAFLLSAGHEENEQWTDLLDRAEAAIENG
jgi:hypothetical protein